VKEKFLLILGVLVLMTASVLAGGPVDVLVESDFGSAATPIAEMTSSSPPGPIGFSLTVTTRVWHDDVTGIYTYVYDFTDSGTSLIGITSVSIDTADFDGSLNWGTVGGPAYLSNVTFDGQLTFQFFPAVPTGSTTTVYAQSTQPPQEYLFWGTGFGPSGTGAYTLGADPPHVYVAEAPSFLFLGTGLLGVVGIGFFRQKFS